MLVDSGNLGSNKMCQARKVSLMSFAECQVLGEIEHRAARIKETLETSSVPECLEREEPGQGNGSEG